jgi:hypothetical protein
MTRSEKHRGFIRQLPCLVCGNSISTEAAHVRYAEPRAAKPITGIGIKPDDTFIVPLCGDCHREQHDVGERKFWSEIDPVYVALALTRISGDHEAGSLICAAWRRK